MDTLQFRVLPVGSLIALITIAWLVVRIRQRGGVRDAVWATVSGIVGGALLVAVLLYVRQLPYAAACLDCGFQDRVWYSCALTFAQGFGFTAGGVVVARALRYRRALTALAE